MAKAPEQHFRLRDAARLAGIGTQEFKKRLIEEGYVPPEGVDTRMVTVPESALRLVNAKYSVKPLKWEK